jgi:membrane protease YdiL (CAAX protease family)
VLALLRKWTVDQWRAIDAERQPPPAGRFDWRPLVVLVTVALVLTTQWYWGDRDSYARLVRRPPPGEWLHSWYELKSFAYWTAWRVGGFLVVPVLVVLCWPGEKLRDFGFSTKGFVRHLWIYLALFLAILPLVIAVSYTKPFREQYPFYKLANRSTFDFVAWEIMYAAQFFSLEFFFRGFMVHGLKRAFGSHAIWVMVVPYTMIHFQKPVLECFGAVFAGIVLGTLALRTRSIWAGVLIHVSVALTMDLLSLANCPPDRPCPTEGSPVWERMPYDPARR